MGIVRQGSRPPPDRPHQKPPNRWQWIARVGSIGRSAPTVFRSRAADLVRPPLEGTSGARPEPKTNRQANRSHPRQLLRLGSRFSILHLCWAYLFGSCEPFPVWKVALSFRYSDRRPIRSKSARDGMLVRGGRPRGSSTGAVPAGPDTSESGRRLGVARDCAACLPGTLSVVSRFRDAEQGCHNAAF